MPSYACFIFLRGVAKDEMKRLNIGFPIKSLNYKKAVLFAR